MKITSGKYKNQALKSPFDEHTHPMGSRERLALFNMMSGKIEGKYVLDAFAGTGALGIEAMSRNAQSVVFIEKNPKVAKILIENVNKILKDNLENTQVLIKSVENFRPTNSFDIIFADPPYDLYSEDLIKTLPDFLDKDGYFILSFPKATKPPVFQDLKLISHRTYAMASIAIYYKR